MVWAAIENVKLIRSNMFEYVEVYEDEWEGQKKSKIKEILYNQAQAEIKKKEEAEEAARLAAELEAEMEAEEYEDDEEADEEVDASEEADENEDK